MTLYLYSGIYISIISSILITSAQKCIVLLKTAGGLLEAYKRESKAAVRRKTARAFKILQAIFIPDHFHFMVLVHVEIFHEVKVYFFYMH